MQGKQGDINRRYREIEAGIEVSIIGCGTPADRCQGCRAKGFVFVSHLFRQNSVRELCKACVIAAAGDEAKVWLRTTVQGLTAMWKAGTRIKVREGRKQKADQD